MPHKLCSYRLIEVLTLNLGLESGVVRHDSAYRSARPEMNNCALKVANIAETSQEARGPCFGVSKDESSSREKHRAQVAAMTLRAQDKRSSGLLMGLDKPPKQIALFLIFKMLLTDESNALDAQASLLSKGHL